MSSKTFKVLIEADKMIKWIYTRYVGDLSITFPDFIEQFKYLNPGQFKAVRNYLKDKQFIDFILMMGGSNSYQPFMFTGILPAGIHYVENDEVF